MPDFTYYIVPFIFGTCIGSFLNVCIYRLPLSRSIVFPGSTCPACSTRIRFYDNIPIISFMLLQARCRHCGAAIAWRYPLVELLSGLLALGALARFGPSWPALIYYLFMAALLVITFIDIDHRIIPDVITLPGIPIGFMASFGLPAVTWLDSLIGLLVGGGVLLAIAMIYHLLTHREGMGGGDIKLLALIGTLTGLKGVLFTVFVSSAVGTVAGLLSMLYTRQGMKLAIPFGPFLSIGAMAYLFFGPELIFWYVHWAR